MASQKPQRSPEEIEDIILRKILLVTLNDENAVSSDPRAVYLEMTAAEILSEGKSLLLSRDLMERVLIDRLSGDFPNSESPFNYLIGCYKRAHEEIKKIANMKDKTLRSEMESAAKQAKKLAVSYARIHLGNPELFSNGNATDTHSKIGFSLTSKSPLLPLVIAEVSSGVMLDGFGGNDLASGVDCPPGFLEEFFKDTDFETLEPILKALYEDLRGTVLKVSALGNFQQPLRALLYLVKLPVGAKCLVNHPWWIPKGVYLNGRVIEMTSILGPFFHVSALPDHSLFRSHPDVGQQCFSEASTRRPADLLSSFTTIKTVMNNLYDGLAEVLLCLLKNTEIRESVDPISSASSGMFVNLSAVMLRLCEPFLDANLTKRDKIDPNYVFYSNRLELRGLTALNATSEEVTEWINKHGPIATDDGQNRLLKSQEASSSSGEKGKYSFISECFFMTARVLNLGLLKAFSDFKHLVQDISRCEDTLATLKAMQEQTPSAQLQLDISRLEKEMELYSQEKFCYEAQILR
ncbi:Ubiquitin conjugation factor E4, core, partial [Corchorus capsularis]